MLGVYNVLEALSRLRAHITVPSKALRPSPNPLNPIRYLQSSFLQVREPHPDIGCWWTLYDYGLDTVKTWAKDYKHVYPGASRTPPFADQGPSSVIPSSL